MKYPSALILCIVTLFSFCGCDRGTYGKETKKKIEAGTSVELHYTIPVGMTPREAVDKGRERLDANLGAVDVMIFTNKDQTKVTVVAPTEHRANVDSAMESLGSKPLKRGP